MAIIGCLIPALAMGQGFRMEPVPGSFSLSATVSVSRWIEGHETPVYDLQCDYRSSHSFLFVARRTAARTYHVRGEADPEVFLYALWAEGGKVRGYQAKRGPGGISVWEGYRPEAEWLARPFGPDPDSREGIVRASTLNQISNDFLSNLPLRVQFGIRDWADQLAPVADRKGLFAMRHELKVDLGWRHSTSIRVEDGKVVSQTDEAVAPTRNLNIDRTVRAFQWSSLDPGKSLTFQAPTRERLERMAVESFGKTAG